MANTTGSVSVKEIYLPLHEAVDYAITIMEGFWEGEKLATPYLAGKPGGGKSEMIKFECEKRGIGFLPITVGLIRPERFTGIPELKHINLLNDKDEVVGKELHTQWSVPEIVCMMREMSHKYDRNIVLFDDWHIANQEIQASGFETFTYRAINQHAIPQNVAIMLAGNNSSLAGARAGFSAVMNRVCKIHVNTDFEYWRDKFAIPHKINNEILSFLDNESNRGLFHGDEDAREPWPSPRSWTECGRAIDRLGKSGLNLDNKHGHNVLLNIVSAHVGPKSASEFMIYHTIYRKINSKEVFRTGKFTLPDKPIERFAFGSACTNEFLNICIKTKQNIDAMKSELDIFGRIISALEKSDADIAIRSIKFLQTADPNIPSLLAKTKTIPSKILASILEVSQVLMK
jgi:hypothetical protein